MAVVVVIRSGRAPDDGVVMHLDDCGEAMAFAYRWQRRHAGDRVTILSAQLEPLAEFGVAHSGVAQSGRDASGTLS